MRYLSVCSGIEAATVAWHSLGWEPMAFSEIEKFPSKVLNHHYPHVPNLGDMTKFQEWPNESIDLLVGGTPCQSFSVAGLRKGLADPRGNLMLTFGAVADKYGPRWIVWENVPGVLSSNRGRDFATFLGALEELGYGFAYRILDAQYFGVAQRRRRVFVIGYLGDWRPAAAVLFERESLSGHPAPSREKGQEITHDIAHCIGASGRGIARIGETIGQDPVIAVPFTHAEISPALKARDCKGVSSDGDGDGAILVPMLANTLRGEGFDASEDGTGKQNLVTIAFPANLSATQHAATVDLSPALGALNPTAVAFNMHKSGNAGSSLGMAEDRTDCLRADGKSPFAVMSAMQVRRLTPTECERLQGFPDGYTDIRPKGNASPDGPRYKALGNSMAVPVMRWIGQRIQAIDDLMQNNVKEAVNEQIQ